MTKTETAAKIAEKCADGYSADRYMNWTSVARALLNAGYDERQTEAIMMSKWARWAADGYKAAYGYVPAKALVEYAQKQGAYEVSKLTIEHFEE